MLSYGGAQKMHLRKSASRDRDGKTGTPEATANGSQPFGMSYFPGFAINIETGERLNIAFGEDSWHAEENGLDMLWNPTSNYQTPLGDILFGGKHFIYIFGHKSNKADSMPSYDQGSFIYQALNSGSNVRIRSVYADAMWVSIPMAAQGYSLKDPAKIPTDATVRIRVQRPYATFFAATSGADPAVNDNYPMYTFSTDELAVQEGVAAVAKGALELIRVVPNPYYAYSDYEKSETDTKVKIINLPEECTVSIYTVNGTLVRRFAKQTGDTWLEWDLKNTNGAPVSGGVYLIHVSAPGIGERVVKWFGTMREGSGAFENLRQLNN
jgi:hypothetical protein